MLIPKIIHQTWKTERIPKKWHPYTRKVQILNPDWEYRLWTDPDIVHFVKSTFPDFYPVFMDYPKNIMRVDVIRYLLMYKIGGVYLDIDYEVIEPFDFQDYTVILPKNRSRNFGDSTDAIGNSIIASIPGHKFWSDVIKDLQNNVPVVDNYLQVLDATGPGFLTRIFNEHTYNDIFAPEKLVYHPPSPRNKKEIEEIKNNKISKGIHHTWGSWREHFTWTYFKYKLNKWFT